MGVEQGVEGGAAIGVDVRRPRLGCARLPDHGSGSEPDMDAVSLHAQPNATRRGMAAEAGPRGGHVRIVSTGPPRTAWGEAGAGRDEESAVLRVRDPVARRRPQGPSPAAYEAAQRRAAAGLLGQEAATLMALRVGEIQSAYGGSLLALFRSPCTI